MSRFEIGDHDFMLDGRPFRVLSGAIHYFRVHPDQWADRIHKARLMGLNTIETYVPWYLHAPEAEEWIDTGGLDLDRFLRTVAAEGMFAIVRPGPYICAEFVNGGLPSWVLSDPAIVVRSSEPGFLEVVARYLEQVTRIVAPLQIDRGGPLILVQVENEYGAYGRDAGYLDALTDLTIAGGITLPLISVDQPEPAMLENGSTPRLHKTASFGSRSRERLAVLRQHQRTGPLMCGEFWNGWFDSWGTHHHTTSAEASAADLDALLSTGASVNLYMFHGGTNFGLTSGANDKGTYVPITTSYDYDAPLSEAGDPTAKYWAYKQVIARYERVPEEHPDVPADSPVGTVSLDARGLLLPDLPSLDAGVLSDDLPTFGRVDHRAAFLVHTTDLRTDRPAVLTIGEVRDRVAVVADGTLVGWLARDHHETALTLPPLRGRLTLLVEDQGGVDYGPRVGEEKGIIGGVSIDGQPVRGWQTRPLREHAIERMPLHPSAQPVGPIPALTVAAGRFSVMERTPCDRFLDTSTFGKGIAWINGFCLGRFWSRGPQRTLYVPGPVLQQGINELRILELASAPTGVARFSARPELGQTEY